MRSLLFVILLFSLHSLPAFAADGLITIKSDHDVKVTADRLERVLEEKK